MNHDDYKKLEDAAWHEEFEIIVSEARTIFERGYEAATNKFVPVLEKAMIDYRGAAHTYATYGMKASAKDALETADYIESVLKGENNDQ